MEEVGQMLGRFRLGFPERGGGKAHEDAPAGGRPPRPHLAHGGHDLGGLPGHRGRRVRKQLHLVPGHLDDGPPLQGRRRVPVLAVRHGGRCRERPNAHGPDPQGCREQQAPLELSIAIFN